MMDIKEFYNEFQQEVHSYAGTNQGFVTEAFVELLSDEIEQEGVIVDYEITSYFKASFGAVDAWSYNYENGVLSLIIADFNGILNDGDSVPSLTQTKLDTFFSRLQRLFESTGRKERFVDKLEPSSPIAKLAQNVYELRKDGKIKKVNLIVLSNSSLSKRVDALSSENIEGIETSRHVFDLNRLLKIRTSGKAKEDLTINIRDYGYEGVPFLSASTIEDKLSSYLLVIPGQLLANIYNRYYDRLLEQNVRTFLQFRGKVNKGMRNTINNQPELFFAYNNGLTTTAESIEIDGDKITKLKNFQIVNGGQTTASIFNAFKADGADLSNVHIQVKLSVVDNEAVEELVPKISEYSNTQNKVNAADFFSNHPFHLRVEELSRRIFAPNKEGGVLQTKWFYERTRGQYANEQARRTPAEKRQFLKENPRSQMIIKTDLAKYYQTFEEKPFLVSLGAQKAFTGTKAHEGFVGIVTKEWDTKSQSINELWFKQNMAKAILFRELDKRVRSAEWYSGYKANIVTYTLAKLNALVKERTRKVLDFGAIWKLQKTPPVIAAQIDLIAEAVNTSLLNPPENQTSNVSEWAKNPQCWEIIKLLKIEFYQKVENYLITVTGQIEAEKKAQRVMKDIQKIDNITYVFEKGKHYWVALEEWSSSNPCLSPAQDGVLRVATQNKILTDKQAKLLIKGENRAIEYGFFFA